MPHSRHGSGEGDLLALKQFVDALAVELRARHDELGSAHRCDESNGPGVGVEHRHDRQHDVAGAAAEHVGLVGGHGVQHVGAVRVEHALGIAGGAGGVAESAGGVLVKPAPARFGRLAGDEVLERHHRQRRLRQVRAIGEGDIELNRLQQRRDLFDDRREGDVEEDDLVFGVIDDPGDLLGEKPRVQSVEHRAHAHGAVPSFKMPIRVPGERCNAITERDRALAQRIGDLLGARADGGIGRALQLAILNGAGDDFAVWEGGVGVIENSIDRQRPILHEPKHRDTPPVIRWDN